MVVVVMVMVEIVRSHGRFPMHAGIDDVDDVDA